MTRTKVYKNGQWSYADNVGTAQWGSIEGTLSNQTDLNTALGNKVDKETGKGLFSGSYNDLTNKPTIPTKTSDLTNDSGFIDNTYHDNSKQDTLVSGTNIKTINNQSILGSGDITIEGEGAVIVTFSRGTSTIDKTHAEIVDALSNNKKLTLKVAADSTHNDLIINDYAYTYDLDAATSKVDFVHADKTLITKVVLEGSQSQIIAALTEESISGGSADIYIPYAVMESLDTESTSAEIIAAFTQDVLTKIITATTGHSKLNMLLHVATNEEGSNVLATFPVHTTVVATDASNFVLTLKYNQLGISLDTLEVTCTSNVYSVTSKSSEEIVMRDEVLAKSNTTAFTPTGDYQPSTKKYVDDKAATKQDTLVSGTNIKTINSQSLLGSGDITISGGSENWELINTVTVTEDVQNILINQDTNGNGFELKKIFLIVTTKPSTDAPTTRYNMRVYTGPYSTRRQVSSVDNIVTKQQAFTGSTANFMMQINLESLVRVGDIVYTGATLIGENITQGYNPRSASGNASRTLLDGYTFVELEAVNASSIFGVGSEIKLYGVRV